MRSILLTICLFIYFGLNAQQVYYDSNSLEGCEPFPVDTAWCRLNGIDKIVQRTYRTYGKKAHKGRSYGLDVSFILKKGIPTGAVYNIYPKDTTEIIILSPNRAAHYDAPAGGYGMADTTIKTVFTNSLNNSFSYSKASIKDKKPQEIFTVYGGIGKLGLYYNTIQEAFAYNDKGYLISIIGTDEYYPKKPYIIFKVDYANGIAKRVYNNEDPGFPHSVYLTCLTYYSKGKKVKLK